MRKAVNEQQGRHPFVTSTLELVASYVHLIGVADEPGGSGDWRRRLHVPNVGTRSGRRRTDALPPPSRGRGPTCVPTRPPAAAATAMSHTAAKHRTHLGSAHISVWDELGADRRHITP